MHDRPLPPPPYLGAVGSGKTRSPRSSSNYGLCCTGFRASITQRPRTSTQEKRPNAKWRAGAGQKVAPILKYGRGAPISAQACGRYAPPFAQAPGWGGVPFFAQAPSSARVPAFPEARGTQRAIGKAWSAAGIRGAASGRERPGADFRRGSRARRNRGLGPSLRSLPFLSLL